MELSHTQKTKIQLSEGMKKGGRLKTNFFITPI